MASATTAGLCLLLDACASPAPSAPAATTSTAPTSAATGVPPTLASTVVSTGAGTATPKGLLPTYVPAQSAKPDLPPSDAGLQSGYFTYPQNLVKSVAQAPGSGSDVTGFTQTVTQAPPGVDQNAAWQAVNKALNVNLKLQITSSGPDYTTKVATVIAGGDVPDLFYLQSNVLTGGMPAFLKAACTDLTPFVSGDAVKEYPNLAALPTQAWKQTVYDSAIYGIPIPRPNFQFVWNINQSRFDEIGATQPKNADDFKRILTELTRPQSNQWGIGATAPGFGLVSNVSGKGDAPQLAMFGAPNNWTVDANGKFTKDLETEQFATALGYVRDLFAAGLFVPDPNLTNNALMTSLGAGKAAVIAGGWISYPILWDTALRANPAYHVGTLVPFSSDGTSKPVWHQYQGFNGLTAIKKGSTDRTRELLRVLNYLAAPFGSEEFHLLNYGVKDTDYTADAQGNPAPTPRGTAELSAGWSRLALPIQVLYDPNDAGFVRAAYALQQATVPSFIADPTVGLYSTTDANKGGPLIQKITDAVGDMVTGRSPLSALEQLRSDWRSGGGDQMRTEYEQAYAASK